ncbi:hypothetical protein pipiens_009706 [Culex pipiens pipiens]|uniref:Uncharacterized protein n=1 Tax=Culex pipiens pipiens TaxID=38569 RepID=A0ABD1DCW3_CULPP
MSSSQRTRIEPNASQEPSDAQNSSSFKRWLYCQWNPTPRSKPCRTAPYVFTCLGIFWHRLAVLFWKQSPVVRIVVRRKTEPPRLRLANLSAMRRTTMKLTVKMFS